MKILALTSIRSEYDLMSGLYRLLHEDPQIDFRLLVSGAHLSAAQGLTVTSIRADGFPILAEVETLISSDTASARLKTAANLLCGSIDIVRSFAPDLILFAGDREDALIGAMMGGFLGIPTLHFFGGDHAADGHIDNPVRHAASKLASVHFVSLAEHRERLLALGEGAERIFVIGSVALDKFVHEPPLDKAAVLAGIGAKPHASTHPLAILIFHPIEAEIELAPLYVSNAIAALVAAGYHVCMGAPNTDPGNHRLVAALEHHATAPEVTYYRNTPRHLFVNLLRHSSLIIGNSSAGLLEAASVPIPAINIGLRQRGRTAPANVIFTGGDRADIEAALVKVNSPAFRAMLATLQNPYGDGASSKRAYELIKRIDFASLTAKPQDPLRSQHARP